MAIRLQCKSASPYPNALGSKAIVRGKPKPVLAMRAKLRRNLGDSKGFLACFLIA